MHTTGAKGFAAASPLNTESCIHAHTQIHQSPAQPGKGLCDMPSRLNARGALVQMGQWLGGRCHIAALSRRAAASGAAVGGASYGHLALLAGGGEDQLAGTEARKRGAELLGDDENHLGDPVEPEEEFQRVAQHRLTPQREELHTHNRARTRDNVIDDPEPASHQTHTVRILKLAPAYVVRACLGFPAFMREPTPPARRMTLTSATPAGALGADAVADARVAHAFRPSVLDAGAHAEAPKAHKASSAAQRGMITSRTRYLP
jgi:hypothetical protein